MKKTLWISLVVAALVCAFALPNLSAAPKAPADMVLKAPFKMKKAPVDFPHKKHEDLKIDCKKCHHAWDGKSAVKKCGDAGCHAEKKVGKVDGFKKAYHDLCIKCHKAEKKGPKACKECHPKK